MALGVFDGYDAAVAAMVRVKDTFQPNEENHRIYAAIYQQAYSKIYGRLRPIYRKIIGLKRRTAP